MDFFEEKRLNFLDYLFSLSLSRFYYWSVKFVDDLDYGNS